MNLRKFSVLTLAAILFTGGIATAKDHDWKHDDKHHDKHQNDWDDDHRRVVIIEHDRNFINNYYVTKYRNCPPGLRKKNAYCMPPGHYQRFGVGQYLPDYVGIRPLPRGLAYGLSPAPVGTAYTYYGNDVYLVDTLNRLILDAVFNTRY